MLMSKVLWTAAFVAFYVYDGVEFDFRILWLVIIGWLGGSQSMELR